jgi:hypothetical protein
MKKIILTLLKEQDLVDGQQCMNEKKLRHAAYKVHLDGEKEEKKKMFKEAMSKLEVKGKITIKDSIVKLVKKGDGLVDVIVEVESGKKRKIKTTETVSSIEVESSEVIDMDKKKKKKEDKTSKIVPEALIEPSVVVIPQSVENVIVKKEYPPIEIPTGIYI